MDGPPGNAAEDRGNTFGARLRRAREAAGLAQEELAERAGLSPNAVGGLERGEHRHPYPATVRALAAALGLGASERAALLSAVPTRSRPTPAPDALPAGISAPLSTLIGREGEVVFSAAWAEGRALPPAEALAKAALLLVLDASGDAAETRRAVPGAITVGTSGSA